MKKLIIFLVSMLSLMIHASPPKKVAVYVIGENEGINTVLGSKLVAAIARSEEYSAIERTAAFLSELNKEQTYQRTGAVDDNELSRLGKQFGVQYVCVAVVSKEFNEQYISARLIDVETAEVLNTHDVGGTLDDMNSCLEMANEIATNLSKGTYQEQAEEKRKEEMEIERKAKEKYEKQRIFEEECQKAMKQTGYVDLGLPSGTLWAAQNESEFYWSNSACKKFGNLLPTKEQFEELIYNCIIEWNDSGLLVKGKNNGNAIFLPNVSCEKPDKVQEYPFIYWTRTTGNCSWHVDTDWGRRWFDCKYYFAVGHVHWALDDDLAGHYKFAVRLVR